MNRINTSSKGLKWSLAIVAAAALVACGGGGTGYSSTGGAGAITAAGAGTGVGGAGKGPAPVNLGTAGNFVILAQSAVTDVPTSAITGNVGVSPASGSFIGLTCTEVTGSIYSVDAAGPLPCVITDPTTLTSAIGDKGIAYTDAGSRAPDYTELGAGNIGGMNLAPGTYKWGTALLIPTDLTLTGGPNDVWIFQIAQGLTISSGVHIVLAGGALPKNIFWQTFAAADIGTTAQVNGVIISQTSIAMKTGSTINGKLLAGTAITLASTTVK
jgi:Ice-binding-like